MGDHLDASLGGELTVSRSLIYTLVVPLEREGDNPMNKYDGRYDDAAPTNGVCADKAALDSAASDGNCEASELS